ncbi:hypothetical protein FQZ97_1060290 [compost metagenome]
MQAALVETADDHQVALTIVLKGVAQQRLHADVRHLDLDYLGFVREAFEHFGKSWNAYALAAVGVALAAVGGPAVTGVQCLQLFQAQRGDRAVAVGGALQGVVVDHHQLAIAGQPHVHLQHVHAQGVGALEGEQAVLRPQAFAAAVGDHQWLVAEGGEHRRLRGRATGLGQHQQSDNDQ